MAWDLLAQRTLPSQATLLPNACCPTRDLVALLPPAPRPAPSSASPPAPPAPPAETKLSLWRTTGNADRVWEWVPKPPPSADAPTPAQTRLGLLGKGKAKDAAPVGTISALAWDPQGTFLAVALTAPPKPLVTTPPPVTLTLLSVQTGTSPLTPLTVPTRGSLTTLSWFPLTHAPDPNLSSFAQSLILRLPALPPIVAQDPQAILAAGMGVAAAGTMFGQAKNALLMREREKEAGRALDMRVSSPGFPVLLRPATPTDEDDPPENDLPHSLLLVGDDQGILHLFLGGTVLLGSIPLPSPSPTSHLLSACILPSSSSTSTRISLTLSTPSTGQLSRADVALDLPPSLEVFTRQASGLQRAVSHAFEAFQEVRVLWDESRRVGKAWLVRLGELSKPHDETLSPTSQLLLLLMHGRPSKALHDFLASKMNERVLTKWETATAAALEKLRTVTFVSVAPAVEQVVLLLDEIKAWASWPEKFAPFSLTPTWLTSSVSLCLTLLSSLATLERLVLEEEKCFNSFSLWLHYELEKLAAAEGSDLKPLARFQPIPVAHYIRHCLSDSAISPFLNFGHAQASLESNADLRAAYAWYDHLADPEVVRRQAAQLTEDVFDESLAVLMKRMKEELKGQADATLVGKPEVDYSGGNWERPAKDSPSAASLGVAKAPVSVAIMLHLLAEKVGEALGTAMKRVGEKAESGPLEPFATVEGGEEKTAVRERVIGHGKVGVLYTAWISASALWICRTASATDEMAAAKLVTEAGDALDVVGFDFFDDLELILVAKPAKSDGSTSFILAIKLASFNFEPVAAPAPFLPISRSHELEAHFNPQGLAINGLPGRRVACVLGGEGRRLQVLDVDTEDSEDDNGQAVAMDDD